MYKYFLYPILISLFISSCTNQRNAKDIWDKKRITTACDCADMAKDVFTEIISDIRKNPGLSMDSIMNSKDAVWKPRFERCDEIEKERRQSQTSSFDEELEKCKSTKELESLIDTLAGLMQPEVDWEIPENNSNIGLCECLVAANSEEEALKCAPDKTIDELMEILTSECLEMAEARYEKEYPVEKPTHEIESEEISEELNNSDLQMQTQENEQDITLKSLQEHLANLEEDLREDQDIIEGLKQDIMGMTQVMDNTDYDLCDCILKHYDCTSSLDQINSTKKKCDSTISGEEIRTLCEDCESRARSSSNIAIPMGLLEEQKELAQEKIKRIEELKTEIELYRQSDSLNRVSFYKSADLAFKAQEIFSALDEQDLDLFKSLVKQDTIDFFYWTIPSKDFTLEKLKNMSATIENMAGDSTTVKAMDYLNDFKSYDMNLLDPNAGFDRAAGLHGSCSRFTGDPWDLTVNKDYQNVSFIDCPNKYLYDCMDPSEEIETLIQDLYRLQGALWCSCVMMDQLWFVFDTSNQKFIGIYDWQWSP